MVSNQEELIRMYREDDKRLNWDDFTVLDTTKPLFDNLKSIIDRHKELVDELLKNEKTIFDYFNRYSTLKILPSNWWKSELTLVKSDQKTYFWAFLMEIYINSCITDLKVNQQISKFNYTEKSAKKLLKEIIESIWINYLISEFKEFQVYMHKNH
jgi:hypothetical protein